MDPTLLLSVGAIVVGFVLLIWGADRFIAGAAALAQDLGVPKLLVGLTVVGLGTSAPEMFVAGVAALQDKPGLAIGNAIGSNITNIALILGITALVAPLVVHNSVLKRELPVLSAVCVGATLLMSDGHLTRLDGAALGVALVAVLVWMARMARAGAATALDDELTLDVPEQAPMSRAVLWTLVGLVALPLSSQMLVWGAVNIANVIQRHHDVRRLEVAVNHAPLVPVVDRLAHLREEFQALPDPHMVCLRILGDRHGSGDCGADRMA